MQNEFGTFDTRQGLQVFFKDGKRCESHAQRQHRNTRTHGHAEKMWKNTVDGHYKSGRNTYGNNHHT